MKFMKMSNIGFIGLMTMESHIMNKLNFENNK